MLFRYVAVWITGIFLMVVVRSERLTSGTVPLADIPTFVWSLRSSIGGLRDDWFVFWSLLVLLWWARDQVRSSAASASKSRHFDYLLLWAVGSIVVVNWGLWFFAKLTPLEVGSSSQPATASPQGFEDGTSFGDAGLAGVLIPPDLPATIGLVAGWSAVVILLMLLLGDGVPGGFYETTLGPYKAVLMTLTVVISLTFLANIFAYFGIQTRVRSLEAPVLLLTRTLGDLATNADNLYLTSNGFRDQVAIARTELDAGKPVTSNLTNSGDTIVQLANKTSDLASTAVRQLETAVEIEIAERAQAVQRGDIEEVDLPDAELSSVAAVLGEARTSADTLSERAGELNAALPYLRREELAGNPHIPPELTNDLVEIANNSRTIFLRAEAAANALAGLESRGATILLWLGAFYSAFVLFPWILLLMFFYRKREFRAVEIIADLKRLDPSNKLLQRALGTEKDTEELTTSAVDKLLERAFSNREYVLSVSLLTVLTAAGWYYFLYPRADIGISDLVRSDAGITQLTTDLATHASPLTMGFAGAYFFVAQMLLRRYLSGDLYPSAFLQGAVRIIWVFTLSVALAVLLPIGENWMKFGAIIAFVAGIFPREGLRLISSAASGLVTRTLSWMAPEKTFPSDTEVSPLTKLDGINIWVESRLLEENVENVQGMATAPIEQLVVGTYYPASRIVDWVDQAILLTHCGELQHWCPSLSKVGIRTATDLLDAASPVPRQAARTLDEVSFEPGEPALRALEKAVKEANGHATPILTAAVLSAMCKVIWPDPNLRYVQRYRDSTDDAVTTRPLSPADSGEAAQRNGKNGATPDQKTVTVVVAADERPTRNGDVVLSEVSASDPGREPAAQG